MIVIVAATAALNAGNAARLSASAGMMGARRLRGAESPTKTQEVMRPMEPMRPVAGHAFSEFELTHYLPKRPAPVPAPPAEPERDYAADYGYYADLQARMRKPVLDFDAWKALETAPRRA